MNILHTLSGPALIGNLAEGLLAVSKAFERGPDTPLSYSTEFKADYSRTRQQSMTLPTPSPAPSGPSM